jgi:hypothetical protein
MAATPEGAIKREIAKTLKKLGVFYYMPVQNGMGKTGIPDFIVCVNGKLIGIEAKAPGKAGNLSANQLQVQKEIIQAKGIYLVVSTVEEARDLLLTLVTLA